MTMAEDHGIIAFLKFPLRKPVHDFHQAVWDSPDASLLIRS